MSEMWTDEQARKIRETWGAQSNSNSALIDLLECECGQVPTMFKPTLGKHMLGTNQQDNPGRFFSMLQCSCGITFDGVDFDENCEKLKAKWNQRILKIRAF